MRMVLEMCTVPRWLVWVILIIIPVTEGLAQAQETAQLFEQGNERYAIGAYSEALALYREALAHGYVSGALYHNMGNAYFRQDSLGQAIRYYEKALRLLPDNVQLHHNLQIARARTRDNFPSLPVPMWKPWWTRTVLTLGALGLFVIGLLFYVASIGLTAYRLRKGSRNPWLRRSRALTVVLGGVFLVAAFAASFTTTAQNRVVILAEELTLREGPEPDAPSLLTLHEGLVLDVLDTEATWVEVRLPNGETGWLSAEGTGEI